MCRESIYNMLCKPKTLHNHKLCIVRFGIYITELENISARCKPGDTSCNVQSSTTKANTDIGKL